MKAPPKPVKGLLRGQEISVRTNKCPTCGTLQTRRVIFVEWIMDPDDMFMYENVEDKDMAAHPVWYVKVINDKGRIEIIHPEELVKCTSTQPKGS